MILTFGSINADIVVPVPKLPQPGETVLGGSYELLSGGKGANQALAARRAGADVMLVGAVGCDGFAAIALASLRGEGVDTHLVRDIELPTGCALIMVASSGENTLSLWLPVPIWACVATGYPKICSTPTPPSSPSSKSRPAKPKR